MTFIRTTAYVLLTGYILCFFSEWMFWSGRPPAPDWILSSIPTWLLYSFITFLFLAVVDYFRVRTIWAVFLAGAIYGWLLEGVIVQTTYDDFPLNISFTALAWHSLISVIFGWCVLPRAMRSRKWIVRWCIGFGLCLGIWSIGWWSETPPAPIENVFVYNFVFGIGLMAAYVWRDTFTFRVNRFVIYGAIILLVAYFALVTVPTQPLALVVLPLLLAISLITLRKNRQREMENIIAETKDITLRHTLPLLWIPLIASVIYGAAFVAGIALPGLQIAYVILMPAGFIVFAISVYKVW